MLVHIFSKNKGAFIVTLSAAGIAAYLVTSWVWALIAVILIGGLPMIIDILGDIRRGEVGADALAVVSIVTSLILKQYLAGSIIVLMLSTGTLLESYAVERASSVLNALLKRSPKLAHRKTGAQVIDLAIENIQIDDELVVFPHEIVPVDGVVIDGHGHMDESFLTGEPYTMSKAPGSEVYSGAINGETAISIRATKAPKDSRYAKITEIMRAAEEKRPHLRRLADQLGGIYVPIALALAGGAWAVSGRSIRFLAVVVVATPCPLIIAIPVAILGAISLCARRGIIVRNPVALEQIQLCRTAIYDKTGTLTYGEPALVEQTVMEGFSAPEVLELASSLERYSKHPLAHAVQKAARAIHLAPLEVSQVREEPGRGIEGTLRGRRVRVTGRLEVLRENLLPKNEPTAEGLECFVVIEGKLAARYRFRDAPRTESPTFIQHLGPRHAFDRQIIVTGDRESEARYLAEAVGIKEIYAEKNPEEKLMLVRQETARAKTLFMGDGINDAPAMLAATVGVALGQNCDVTAEAASVVVLENSLRRVDEFMHISERLRSVALQSAIGGMTLSFIGMIAAATGHLSPVAGAIAQEAIDLLSIVNALRVAIAPPRLTDL